MVLADLISLPVVQYSTMDIPHKQAYKSHIARNAPLWMLSRFGDPFKFRLNSVRGKAISKSTRKPLTCKSRSETRTHKARGSGTLTLFIHIAREIWAAAHARTHTQDAWTRVLTFEGIREMIRENSTQVPRGKFILWVSSLFRGLFFPHGTQLKEPAQRYVGIYYLDTFFTLQF